MNEPFRRAAAAARVDLAHEPDFALGPVRVRPSLREITCDGSREIIDRRVMQVLVALARTAGSVVSRDDLIESCWEGVVVGEDAINNCISRLRRVAEVNGNAFAIETVSRVGYRLIAAEKADRLSSDSSPPRTGRPSICVLPFSNMSSDSEQEYLADGISEDIITDLSKCLRFRLSPAIRRSSGIEVQKTMRWPRTMSLCAWIRNHTTRI